MVMYLESLKAGISGVVRAYPPWQGGPMPRWEQRKQARKAFVARALKRGERNVKTSVVLEAKALGGGRS
jgi:hypothetical protein